VSNGILVIAESKDGRLANVSLESLTEARSLAEVIGGPVSAAVMAAETSPLATQAGRYGAERVYTVESPELAVFRPGPFADAAAAAIAAAEPALVLFSNSPDGRDVATAVAARLNVGLLVDITAVEIKDGAPVFVHPSFGGSLLVEKQATTSPVIATIRPNSFAREEAPREPEVVSLSVDFGATGLIAKIAEVVCENAGIVSLEDILKTIFGEVKL
jgi:electron transfer flavoprotein alpha subunit